MMFKKLSVQLVLLFVLSVFVLTAYAGLHFVGSANFGSGSLRASVDISGFGSDTDTIFVTLSANGTGLTAMCQNKGGNVAPGQNPVSVSTSVTETVSPKKNGRAAVDFHVELLPTAVEAGCPNRNWKVTDLLGMLNVNLTAVNASNGDTASLNFTCFVDEANEVVACTPV